MKRKIEKIKLQTFFDDSDGILTIAEAQKNICFDIKRVFFIYDLKSNNAIRGKHAHKKIQQAIFCIQGSCQIKLDDCNETTEILLDKPDLGILIPPMVWNILYNFSDNCILLVLASDYFDEKEYIRDYEKFKILCKKNID
jgi:dTDP-4-dehydrorhamnose 3,5-epimerase-like enzyme